VFLNVHFQGPACFTNITSATFTLPCLLDISVWPGCDQCSPECMFGFKNGSDVMISNVPEFFRNTPDVGDHYCAVGYFLCLWKDCYFSSTS
jgi:hypothetical protein